MKRNARGGMREAKKITLSAALVALGVVFMLLGALVEVVDLTVAALCSLLVVFAFIEIGAPYPWLIWLGTSVIAYVIYPNSIIGFEYFLIFGIYPILKAYIERMHRPFWFPVKIVYINLMLAAIVAVCEFLLGVPFFDFSELSVDLEKFGSYLKIGFILLMNIAFVAYDWFITVMVRVYLSRFRSRFAKYLK